MLFSNDAVARMIQESFEPVWESVRPVPVLTLDFGNGNVVTRTLHGNIASYVCSAEGKILDVLPGIYDAKNYTEQLNQMWLLHGYLQKKPTAERESALRDYHHTQAEALRQNLAPGRFTEMDMSKLRVERTAKNLLIRFVPPSAGEPAPAERATKRPAVKPERADVGKGRVERPAKKLVATSVNAAGGDQDVSRWSELVQDTQINEKTRRLQIHERLTGESTPMPAGLTKWLYAEVLHADLDDPYLGLGSLLNGDYPFRDRAGR